MNFKAAVVSTTCKSDKQLVLSKIMLGIRAIFLKGIEFMFASGSSAFYLMVWPHQAEDADCSWEGDMSVTWMSYITCYILIIGGLVSLPLIGWWVDRSSLRYVPPTVFGVWFGPLIEASGLHNDESNSVKWAGYLDKAKVRNERFI